MDRSRRRCALAATFGSWVIIRRVRPEACSRPAEEVEDVGAGGGVEVAGRLVREHHGGLGDQGAGDRHPLHFAAGQLAGVVVGAGAQAHLLQGGAGAREPLGTTGAPVEQGSGDVVEGGGPGQQVEALEYEADGMVPDFGAAGVADVADVLAGELVDAGVRLVEQPEDVSSVLLPEPEGPMIATHSPGQTSRSTPSRTGTGTCPRR